VQVEAQTQLSHNVCGCRSICRQNIPAAEPLLMSLFSSLLSMPTDHDAGTLQYTVAMMIGSYAAWLASTVRVEQRGQLLVSQMLQLLMKCKL